jgi:hypothetical protein
MPFHIPVLAQGQCREQDHQRTEKRVMSKDNSSSSGGVGFVGLLTLIFITLKLIGEISWSWWWVLSPIWISVGLAVLLLIPVLFIARRAIKKW